MIKEVELEVFFHTDETETSSEIGVDFDYADCDTRMMTFYNINGIYPHKNNGITYCGVLCNGSEFICVQHYETVKKILHD